MPILNLAKTRWKFRDTTSKTWLPATVPGCVHTDLITVGKDPRSLLYGTNELDLQWIEERHWEYRTTFNASAALLAESGIDLCADGLATVATVTLNGKKSLHRQHVHRPPLGREKHLRAGRNELVVHFRSAMD